MGILCKSLNSTQKCRGRGVIRIDGTETIDGIKYHKAIEIFSGLPGWESSVYYIRRDEQGIFFKDGLDAQEYLLLKFPLEIGSTWTYTSTYGDFTSTVLGLETVYLMDKKYEDCFKIRGKREQGGEYIFGKGCGNR